MRGATACLVVVGTGARRRLRLRGLRGMRLRGLRSRLSTAAKIGGSNPRLAPTRGDAVRHDFFLGRLLRQPGSLSLVDPRSASLLLEFPAPRLIRETAHVVVEFGPIGRFRVNQFVRIAIQRTAFAIADELGRNLRPLLEEYFHVVHGLLALRILPSARANVFNRRTPLHRPPVPDIRYHMKGHPFTAPLIEIVRSGLPEIVRIVAAEQQAAVVQLHLGEHAGSVEISVEIVDVQRNFAAGFFGGGVRFVPGRVVTAGIVGRLEIPTVIVRRRGSGRGLRLNNMCVLFNV